MRQFLSKIFSKTLILFLFISLTHCTGIGSPGSGPGNLSGSLDGGTAVGVGAAQPGAPVSQPPEDGVLRIRPQKVIVRVLPPRNFEGGNGAELIDELGKAEYLSINNSANPTEEDSGPGSTGGPGHPGTILDADESPLEAQQVPGPFVDSQPYVWFQEVGGPLFQQNLHPTNEYGLVNLELHYTPPKAGEECSTEFRFYACDEISERVWLARPVSALCPLGDYQEPYEVELQLLLPVLDDSESPMECPPTLATSAQEAPTNQQLDPQAN